MKLPLRALKKDEIPELASNKINKFEDINNIINKYDEMNTGRGNHGHTASMNENQRGGNYKPLNAGYDLEQGKQNKKRQMSMNQGILNQYKIY